MAEQRIESRDEVIYKFGFDPGNSSRSGGVIVQRFGDQIRVIGEMTDRGDYVEFAEVHFPRPSVPIELWQSTPQPRSPLDRGEDG